MDNPESQRMGGAACPECERRYGKHYAGCSQFGTDPELERRIHWLIVENEGLRSALKDAARRMEAITLDMQNSHRAAAKIRSALDRVLSLVSNPAIQRDGALPDGYKLACSEVADLLRRETG